MISALASWKTNEFGDNVKPEVSALGDPALTITVTLKDGKKVTALVGNKKSDDEFYVKNGESPQVFVVKKWAIEHVNKRPIDFRDKTICDIDASDLTEVAVTHGAESYTIVKNGKDWKATKAGEDRASTPARSRRSPGAFKAWKATGFADDPSSLKDAGLAKPQATIVAKSKAATCTAEDAATRARTSSELLRAERAAPPTSSPSQGGYRRTAFLVKGRRHQEDDGSGQVAVSTRPASRASCGCGRGGAPRRR